MGSLGEAVFDLAANIKPLEQGMKDGQSVVQSATSAMQDATEKNTGGIGGVFGKIGSIAGGVLKAGLVVGTAAVGTLAGALTGCIAAAMGAELAETQLDAVLRSTGATAERAAGEYEKASKTWVTETRKPTAELAKLGQELTHAEAKLADMEKAMSKNKAPTETQKLALADLRTEVSSLRTAIGDGSQVVTMTLAEKMGLLPPVVRMTKEELVGLANGLGQVTMFEDDAIVAGESILLTFTQIGADVFPQATETMLDMSQALGQDLKSSAVQLGKALNDPIAGVSALSRVGVSFTEAQKAQIAAMVEAGNVAGAQKLILQELQTEFGGSAVAAGQTLSGQLTILKNTLGNVGETIGGVFLPMLTSVGSRLVTTLGSPSVQAAITGIATALGQLFSGNVQGAFASLAGALSHVFGMERALQIYQFLTGLHGMVSSVITAIAGVLQSGILQAAFGTLVAMFQSLMSGDIKGALSAFFYFFTEGWLGNGVAGVMTKAQGIINQVIGVLTTSIIPALVSAFQAVFGWVQANWPTIQGIISTVFGVISSVINTVVTTVLPLVVAAFQSIFAWVQANWPLIQSTITTAITTIQTIIQTVLGAIQSFWNEWGTTIMAAVETIWTYIQTTITNAITIVKGVIQTIMALISGDWEGAWEAIKGVIATVWSQIQTAIGAALDVLKLIIPIALDVIKRVLSNAWDAITGVAQAAWQDVKKAITTPIDEALETIKGIIERIKSAFSGMKVHIPSPHFSGGVNWEQIGPLSVPVPYVNVAWYGSGMAPTIFDSPTLIGVGERGAEMVSVTPLRSMGPAGMEGGGAGGRHYNLTYQAVRQEAGPLDAARAMRTIGLWAELEG